MRWASPTHGSVLGEKRFQVSRGIFLSRRAIFPAIHLSFTWILLRKRRVYDIIVLKTLFVKIKITSLLDFSVYNLLDSFILFHGGYHA